MKKELSLFLRLKKDIGNIKPYLNASVLIQFLADRKFQAHVAFLTSSYNSNKLQLLQQLCN